MYIQSKQAELKSRFYMPRGWNKIKSEYHIMHTIIVRAKEQNSL